jgi:hypothetical protein
MKKSCPHTKTYNRVLNGKFIPICNYCGREVNEVKFGTQSPKFEHIRDVTKVQKMGRESIDPRTKQAENLKRQYNRLTNLIKKNAGDSGEYEALKKQKLEIKAELEKLQASFEV